MTIEITPESLAAKNAAMPYRLRCLTNGCWLADTPQASRFADALTPAGELHVMNTGHRVVIEGPEHAP